MLGLDNPVHIAFLLLIVLLLFGAKRLPEIGSSLGAGLRGFKESITGEGGQSQSNTAPAATLTAANAPVADSAVRPVTEPQRPAA